MHDDALRFNMLRDLDDLVLGEDLAVQSVLWVDIKCEVDESSFLSLPQSTRRVHTDLKRDDLRRGGVDVLAQDEVRLDVLGPTQVVTIARADSCRRSQTVF